MPESKTSQGQKRRPAGSPDDEISSCDQTLGLAGGTAGSNREGGSGGANPVGGRGAANRAGGVDGANLAGGSGGENPGAGDYTAQGECEPVYEKAGRAGAKGRTRTNKAEPEKALKK